MMMVVVVVVVVVHKNEVMQNKFIFDIIVQTNKHKHIKPIFDRGGANTNT